VSTRLRTQLEQSRQANAKLRKEIASNNLKSQKFVQDLLRRHEEDRKEISRELHDEIAQLLTGINFELSVLTKEASKSDQRLQSKITETQLLISNSVEVIHQFARQLRPLVLDHLGLVSALKSAVKEFTRITNIPVEITAPMGISKLSNINKTVLFRVAQEALFNITKHADATQVKIKLKKYVQTIKLEISDNGKSFDKNSKNSKKNHLGFGIQAMEERVKMVHGTFKITSKKGSGTKITASVPFDKED
jgi:two-component system, NarL family, sensor histidine kinase DegS